MLVFKGHIVAGTMLVWVACDITQGHAGIFLGPAAESHVSVHGPVVSRVCFNAHDSTEDLHKQPGLTSSTTIQAHGREGLELANPSFYPIYDLQEHVMGQVLWNNA